MTEVLGRRQRKGGSEASGCTPRRARPEGAAAPAAWLVALQLLQVGAVADVDLVPLLPREQAEARIERLLRGLPLQDLLDVPAERVASEAGLLAQEVAERPRLRIVAAD